MLLITKVTSVHQDDVYDIRINLLQKEDLINKYSLQEYGVYKEYWINNVNIISNKKNTSFYSMVDICSNLDIEEHLLFQEIDKKEREAFTFYQTNIEEKYILYENTINDVVIKLKEFNDFLTLDFLCENKGLFDQFYLNYK